MEHPTLGHQRVGSTLVTFSVKKKSTFVTGLYASWPETLTCVACMSENCLFAYTLPLHEFSWENSYNDQLYGCVGYFDRL